MTPEEASAAHDRNWITTFAALAGALPRGFALVTPTVRVAASGTAIRNKVIVIDPVATPQPIWRPRSRLCAPAACPMTSSSAPT